MTSFYSALRMLPERRTAVSSQTFGVDLATVYALEAHVEPPNQSHSDEGLARLSDDRRVARFADPNGCPYLPDSFEFSPEKSLGRSSRTPMRDLFGIALPDPGRF
ncbi:hypothetical protein [Salinibacter ruber]|uniref:Uncharacterized protein n=1 Tax=Salinibacter ruber TaxID=146919 RepID=A0A9X2Q9U4_9BACT|nr:hypothetical protein [Salinibacter ruber]MCS3662354.1 hypothetical protein [Salinibacter ruber]MCS3712146.1 hypothetical protein [Salinibacter ruber]